jgi:hypothetical protein
LQSQIQRLLDDSDSGTPPKTKKGAATGIFKEKEFSRMSFNPRMNNPPAKRESIGGDSLEVHDEGNF